MEIDEAAKCFSAISQEARLAVLRMLIRAGSAGKPAGAIADELNVPAPTMSFHLKALTQAGLIQSRKDGRSVIYFADYGGLRGLIEFLMADCCQGDPRLCGPYAVKEAS